MTGGKLLILLPLLAIPVARRIQRDMNFQRVGSIHIRLRIVFMSLGSVVFTGMLVLMNPYLALLTWAISLSLLSLSLRLTDFERRNDGVWFRTNPWVGGALVVLFLGRIGYRLYQLMNAGGLDALGGNDPAAQIGRSPFSLMVVLLLLSYHAVYYLMVTRRAADRADDPVVSLETLD